MPNTNERQIGLQALPNEIFYSIFSNLSTSSLLPISFVSRRIHHIVHETIHRRILSAVQITDRKLTLECFHPAAEKVKSPIEFRYNGTFQGSVNPISDDLKDLYSQFLSAPAATAAECEEDSIPASRDLVIESYEPFSQQCVFTKLLKPSPYRGLFLSCTILGENVIRIWRDWLVNRAKEKNSDILWIDTEEDVGLKVRVVEASTDGNQFASDQDLAYTLVFEELVIRSTKLLLQVEESIEQEEQHKGMFCGLDGEYVEESIGPEDLTTAETLGNLWMPAYEAFARGVYGLS